MRRLWVHSRGQEPLLDLRVPRLGGCRLAEQPAGEQFQEALWQFGLEGHQLLNRRAPQPVVHLQITRRLIPIARAALDPINRLPPVESIPNVAPEQVVLPRELRAPLGLRLVEGIVHEAEAQDRAFAGFRETDLLVGPRAEPARVLREVQMVERPPSLGKLHEVGFASGLPPGLFFRRFSRKSFPLRSDGRGIARQAAGEPEEFCGPSLKRGPAVLLAPNHGLFLPLRDSFVRAGDRPGDRREAQERTERNQRRPDASDLAGVLLELSDRCLDDLAVALDLGCVGEGPHSLAAHNGLADYLTGLRRGLARHLDGHANRSLRAHHFAPTLLARIKPSEAVSTRSDDARALHRADDRHDRPHHDCDILSRPRGLALHRLLEVVNPHREVDAPRRSLRVERPHRVGVERGTHVQAPLFNRATIFAAWAFTATRSAPLKASGLPVAPCNPAALFSYRLRVTAAATASSRRQWFCRAIARACSSV